MQLSTILLVEDSLVTEKAISDAVLNWGAKGSITLLKANCIAGLRKMIENNKVDVILLDLSLVDSSQNSTITFLKEHLKELPPVVVMTSAEPIEVRQDCLNAGVGDFVLKKHVFASPNFFFAQVYNAWFKYQINA